jgi:hypothetical protein
MIGLVAVWANYKIHRVPIPVQERLAECTASNLDLTLSVRHRPPYQFLLGVPPPVSLTEFRGEIWIQEGTNVISRLPVASDNLTPCTWLERRGLAGYILTWSLTNRGERLDDVLTRGHTYRVQVAFSQPPPRESSLWLSSIGKIGDK